MKNKNTIKRAASLLSMLILTLAFVAPVIVPAQQAEARLKKGKRGWQPKDSGDHKIFRDFNRASVARKKERKRIREEEEAARNKPLSNAACTLDFRMLKDRYNKRGFSWSMSTYLAAKDMGYTCPGWLGPWSQMPWEPTAHSTPGSTIDGLYKGKHPAR